MSIKKIARVNEVYSVDDDANIHTVEFVFPRVYVSSKQAARRLCAEINRAAARTDILDAWVEKFVLFRKVMKCSKPR